MDEYFLMILEGKFRSFRRLSYRIVPLTSLFVLIVLWNIWNKTNYQEIQTLGLNPFLSRPLFLVLPTILIYIWCLLRIFRRISKQIRWSKFRKNYTLRIGILIVGFCLALSIHGLITLARGGQTAHQLSGIAIGFFCVFYMY